MDLWVKARAIVESCSCGCPNAKTHESGKRFFVVVASVVSPAADFVVGSRSAQRFVVDGLADGGLHEVTACKEDGPVPSTMMLSSLMMSR